jgi:hypothetical protein
MLRGRAPWKRDGRPDVCEPGDELHGDYTRERLLAMDAKFCARVEQAISAGCEHGPCEPGETQPRRR